MFSALACHCPHNTTSPLNKFVFPLYYLIALCSLSRPSHTILCPFHNSSYHSYTPSQNCPPASSGFSSLVPQLLPITRQPLLFCPFQRNHPNIEAPFHVHPLSHPFLPTAVLFLNSHQAINLILKHLSLSTPQIHKYTNPIKHKQYHFVTQTILIKAK